MTDRICLLKDIHITLAVQGTAMVFSCKPDGGEGEPIKEVPSDQEFRIYECANCGWQTQGHTEADFAVVRAHLGKRHELTHPFGGHLCEQAELGT